MPGTSTAVDCVWSGLITSDEYNKQMELAESVADAAQASMTTHHVTVPPEHKRPRASVHDAVNDKASQ